MFSKKRYPIICLLEIPVEIFLYAIAVGLGAQLDALLFSGQGTGENGGHGFPFFTAIVFVLASVVLMIAIIASIVNFIRYSIQKRQRKKNAESGQSPLDTKTEQ